MTPRSGPLARHPLVHTRSLDEARELYGRLNTPITLDTTERRKDFEWRGHRAAVGPVAISTSSYRCGFRGFTDSVDDIYSMAFPLGAAGGEAIIGGRRVPVRAARSGFVVSPLAAADVRMQRDYRGLQVVIRRPLVEAALGALIGRPVRAPLRFEPRLSLADGVGASLRRLLRFVVDELDREPGPLAAPLVAARYAEILIYTLVTGQPHDHAAALAAPATSAEPRHVRVVAEYLEAHAAEAVTLADLPTVAGVSVRSIHAGFRTHRGCTPMEFLRQRRLELARTRLLASPGGTVTEIALACGFEHLGRFSAAYRARFGESPAETLRRAAP